jgi:N-acetyl-alpha-D-muramate 1-phosphate uridylyltransferase
MVLAAGRGERMRPLTDRIPKPLLTAGGRSLIEWQVRRLVAAGFAEIVVNVSHHAHAIEQSLGDGARLGAQIRYSYEPQALETAGGIAQALPGLGGGPFVAVNADVYCEYDLARLRAAGALLSAGETAGSLRAYLVLVDNPEHHPAGDFTLTDGRVGGEATGRLTFSGIGIYHPSLFAHIPAGERAGLGGLLYAAAARGEVQGEHYTGRWFDIGTPPRLAALRALLGDADASSLEP